MVRNIYSINRLTDVRQPEKLDAVQETQTKTITFRPSDDDRKLIKKMASKLGIKTSQVIKIALRRLAESEGLKLRVS